MENFSQINVNCTYIYQDYFRIKQKIGNGIENKIAKAYRWVEKNKLYLHQGKDSFTGWDYCPEHARVAI